MSLLKTKSLAPARLHEAATLHEAFRVAKFRQRQGRRIKPVKLTAWDEGFKKMLM